MISFSGWTTSRIKFLLDEYRQALKSAYLLKCRDDIELYSRWIRGMEAELEIRGEDAQR
jgi:hypothetical protein